MQERFSFTAFGTSGKDGRTVADNARAACADGGGGGIVGVNTHTARTEHHLGTCLYGFLYLRCNGFYIVSRIYGF